MPTRAKLEESDNDSHRTYDPKRKRWIILPPVCTGQQAWIGGRNARPSNRPTRV